MFNLLYEDNKLSMTQLCSVEAQTVFERTLESTPMNYVIIHPTKKTNIRWP